ncbi:MAG: hypothetical protein COV65_05460 [Nitrosopumilales archaeon CG11_big_fil_rev_8_21_14_0_20_33_24]|nr:MAG: hypothetical protein COV65_05460 [Nitrosopumilales archaeon CG11_big_fil_rev_8_21_14_0_20_33_24]
MHYWFLFILSILIFTPAAFAQPSVITESHNSSLYVLKIDDHTYSISYDVNADVIAMGIDPESKSLLIGVKNTHDSKFLINLKHEMINAVNNDFLILVDGQETDYDVISDSDSFTFAFYVPAGTEEIEIIGTFVIPEFPIGSIFVYALIILPLVIFSNIKTRFLSRNFI